MSIEIVKDYMFFLFFFGWGGKGSNVDNKIAYTKNMLCVVFV